MAMVTMNETIWGKINDDAENGCMLVGMLI